MKLIHNAHFYLNDGFNNQVQALLVQEGRIIHLLEDISTVPPGTEMVDLAGAYAYPGFTDAHTHSFSGGLYLDGIDLAPCTSIADVLDLLAASEHKQGLIFAWHLDEYQLKEKRFPTVRELDSVLPDASLLLRRIDGHSCVLNSKARKLIPGLNSRAEILTAADNDFAVNWLQDNCADDAILRAYHKAAQAALEGGFSTIHTMIGDAQQNLQHYALVQRHLADFPVRYELYPQSFNIRAALELGAKRIGGCILADGSIGSHTAAMTHTYRDRDSKGILYQSDEFWNAFISEAHQHKLQVGVHCIGDAAIRQINKAYLHQSREEVAQLRHQLIHCEVTPDALVEEIVTSGAVPVMQPAFDLLWGGDEGFYAQRLGVERSRKMNRFGSLTRSGVTVCGSSDWYITELDVAMSISALINHHNPAERLTPQEAIKIYTENNAWLNHEEQERGRLEPGFIADLSVLDSDLTQAFDYRETHTKFILRNGETVYAAD